MNADQKSEASCHGAVTIQSDPLPYIYRWNRQDRKGQLCAVEARGTMNSCLVVFQDGYTMITSRNALMKAPVDKTCGDRG